jgi:hypothetical protein
MKFPEECNPMLEINRSKNKNLNTMYSYSVYEIIEKLPLHNSAKKQLFSNLNVELNRIFWEKACKGRLDNRRKEDYYFNDYEIDLFKCLLYFRNRIVDKTNLTLYKIIKIYRKDIEEILGGRLPEEFIEKIKKNFSVAGD